MNKLWDDDAWKDYVDWQSKDAKIVQRINNLVKDIERNGVSKGIGKPERLKHMKRWSRRINDETSFGLRYRRKRFLVHSGLQRSLRVEKFRDGVGRKIFPCSLIPRGVDENF